jgi:hypothetical protein
MKNKRMSKCAKILGKLMLITILVGLVGRLTQSENEKNERMARRKERHKEWASGKMFFSDEQRDIW